MGGLGLAQLERRVGEKGVLSPHQKHGSWWWRSWIRGTTSWAVVSWRVRAKAVWVVSTISAFRDPASRLLVEEGVRVADRDPGLLVDLGDRRPDRGVEVVLEYYRQPAYDLTNERP